MSGESGGERASLPENDLSCEACEHENPHFAAGDRWMLAGPLAMDTAASVLEASREAALPGRDRSLAASRRDSAAVAVLLACGGRRGRGQGPVGHRRAASLSPALAEGLRRRWAMTAAPSAA